MPGASWFPVHSLTNCSSSASHGYVVPLQAGLAKASLEPLASQEQLDSPVQLETPATQAPQVQMLMFSSCNITDDLNVDYSILTVV